MAQQRKSYLKDATHFINFVEKTKVPPDAIPVSMEITSLYTNMYIQQQEGIHEVCRAYEAFYINELPIPRELLEKAPGLMLQENL